MSRYPLRWFLFWVGLAAGMVAFCFAVGWNEASAQQQLPNPAQEQVERTIGSLVIGNATCSAQNTALIGKLDAVQKELAELKAKQAPQEPKQ